jgi:surface-anchored protein
MEIPDAWRSTIREFRPIPTLPPFTMKLRHYFTLILASSILATVSAKSAPIYSNGHGDIDIVYTDGLFQQRYSLDAQSLVNDHPAGLGPSDVVFGPDALFTFIPDVSLSRPPGVEFDFIGNTEGEPLWLIPEVQEFDRPWLGFSSESLVITDWISLEIGLVAMSGPSGGHFSLSQSSPFGDLNVKMATFDGISSEDAFDSIIGSHAHYNWIFSKSGIYELEFIINGHHVTDGLVTSTATYTVGVAQVPEPHAVCLVALSATILAVRRRRFAGLSLSNLRVELRHGRSVQPSVERSRA